MNTLRMHFSMHMKWMRICCKMKSTAKSMSGCRFIFWISSAEFVFSSFDSILFFSFVSHALNNQIKMEEIVVKPQADHILYTCTLSLPLWRLNKFDSFHRWNVHTEHNTTQHISSCFALRFPNQFCTKHVAD